MKVLLRENLQWHECTFDVARGDVKLTASNYAVNDNDIIAIKDDERKKYVKCVQCGEIIRNTKKAIAEHGSKKCDEKACFTCPHLRQNIFNSGENKYTLLPDGNYKVKREDTVSLYCNLRYRGVDIRSEDARNGCRHRNCSEDKDNFKPINTFFTTYPDAFNDLLTVDALDEKEWTFDSRSGNKFTFKAKKKFSLYAVANDKGIITHFYYKQRYDRGSFLYSKKYNQIFWVNNSRTYTTDTPYFVSKSRCEEINKAIKKVYNYEVTK